MGPGAQCFGRVRTLGRVGDDDDRDRISGPPQLAQQLDTAEAGQAVGDHGAVEATEEERLERLGAAGPLDDLKVEAASAERAQHVLRAGAGRRRHRPVRLRERGSVAWPAPNGIPRDTAAYRGA